MTKKEQLEKWKKSIKIAREYRKPYLQHWKYWQQIYDGNLWGNMKFENIFAGADKNKPVVINELDPIINNIIPQIDFSYPIFDVDDLVSGNSLVALVYETYALKLYEYLDMFMTVRNILLDTLLLGGGVHKTGMLYDVEIPEYNIDQTGSQDILIKNELPLSAWVTPESILWDYRYNSWKDKRWIAEEIVKPLDEIKESGLYENTSNLKSNISSLDNLPSYLKSQFNANDLNDMVTLIEIHDLVEGKIYTISLGHDKFLQYDDDYGIEIYDQLEFTPTRPKRFWGKSITQDIENHLVRLAYANHYMDEDVAQAARKIFEVDSSVGAGVVAKLESDDPRLILPIDGLTSMSADPIREITTSANTFQWQNVMSIIERQIRGISGSTMQERGVHEPGVETKAEALMLKGASETRNQDRAMLLSLFLQKVMSKMLKISSDFMRTERIAGLIGIPVQDAWMIEPFDRMKLSVKFGSTAIEARQVYLQKLMTVAQAFPDLVNRYNLMQKFMTALGFGMKDQDLLINQMPAPQEQQVQQQGKEQPQAQQGSPF